jgi:hypothetical protein
LETVVVEAEGEGARDAPWLTPGVGAIGSASLFADLGHEIPTALLPSFLTSTLGAPAAALGAIEGVSDGLAGAARFAGGALADDPHRRRDTAVVGYTATAVLTAAIGVTTAAWQVAVFRASGWAARGLRVPSRTRCSQMSFRRASTDARTDSSGRWITWAIGGPLLALALVALVGVRSAILLSVVPGLLAAVAIVIAIRSAPRLGVREQRPLRIQVRPVLRGGLGRLFLGVGAFEFGNAAATLLIRRATDLLEPGRGAMTAPSRSRSCFTPATTSRRRCRASPAVTLQTGTATCACSPSASPPSWSPTSASA